MDSFEINKIVAAILMVALLIIGIGKISDIIFYVEKPKTPGYAVEVEQVAASTTKQVLKQREKIRYSCFNGYGRSCNWRKSFQKMCSLSLN